MKASEILRRLRWEPDMKVVNYYGEYVWLKELYRDGKRIGITDCCLVDDPCDWHRALADALAAN